MPKRNLLLVICVFGLLSTLLAGLGRLSARAKESLIHPSADFDRDFYADLAIGVPGNDSAGVEDAGAVYVGYGGLDDWSFSGQQYWHQNPPDIVDTTEPFDRFGQALAVGDFDGDGYTDLAVGVPGENVNGTINAGAVHVFYSSGLLSASDDEIWHQATGSIQSLPEEDDWFGQTLAAGDFDGDGCDDLAVGVPFEDWNVADAGIVQVLYGSPDGLTDVGNDLWRQGAGGLQETEEIYDRFGEVLTAGDFNADGRDDLAIGVPHEDFEDPSPTRGGVGVVHVLYGTVGGLSSDDEDLWYQDHTYMEDESEDNDYFSWALTAGDFDGEGHDDLAVGVPGEDIGAGSDRGAVHVLFGGTNGLTVVQDVLLDQDDLGLTTADGDHFGKALAAGDFDGDGRDDLAVGAPNRDFLGIVLDDAGSVSVLYGAESGPSTTRHVTWQQGDLFHLADEPEEDDQFGYSLAAGDFDGNGYCDLVIGVPYEDIEFMSELRIDAGIVHILFGTPSGLDYSGDWWLSDVVGGEGPDHYELFGFSLAAVPDVFHRVHLPLVIKAD